MGLFYRRPAAGAFAAFILSALVGFYISSAAKLAAVTLSVIAAGCAAFFALRAGRRGAAALACALALATSLGMAVQWLYFDVYYADLNERTGEQVTISATVLSRDYTSSYSSGYIIRMRELDGEACCFKAALSCEYLSELQPGYRFTAQVESVPQNEFMSEGLWRYSDLTDGVLLKLSSESEEDYDILEEDAFELELWVTGLNRRLGSLLRRSIPGQEGELTAALLLGDRSGLEATTRRDFARSGVSHLLALSGLHFSIIVGLIGLLLRKLGLPRALRCVMLVAAIVGYLALVGFGLSACRAAIMLALVYLSFFASARPDGVTSLTGAMALIILLSPASILDIGLWLSVLATLGIILGLPLLDALKARLLRSVRSRRARHVLTRVTGPIMNYILVPLVGTIAANAATCLVVWLAFGEISVCAVVTNLILSPLTGLLLLLGVLTLGLAWAPPIMGAFAALCDTVAGWMLSVTAHFSRLSGRVVSLRYDFAGVIVVIMTALLLILAMIRLKHRWLAALPVPAAVVAFAIALTVYSSAHAGEVELFYMRDKKNEVIVAVSDGAAVLCDLSDGSYGGLYRGMRQAEKCGAVEVSALVLTHYHQRHISSVYRLCCSELVRQIYLPFPQNETEYNIMWSIVYDAEREGCEVVVYRDAQPAQLSDTLSLVAHRSYIKRSTHPTLALSLQCGDEAVTYIGTSVHESAAYEAVSQLTVAGTEIIFGAHGPVLKSRFSYPTGDRLRSMVFATAETVAYYDAETVALPGNAVGITQFFHVRMGADFGQALDKADNDVYNNR